MQSALQDRKIASHKLTWPYGEATILATAAMLAECRFDLPSGPFSPFAKAPWMGSVHDRSIIGHLRELGGDFVCVPFGAGGHRGHAPEEWAVLTGQPPSRPIHGPAGNEDWTVTEADPGSITLALDYPDHSPVARLERVISARADAPALDFELIIHARRPAAISVGLHPIIRLPERSGALELSADFAFGLTHPFQTALGQSQEFSDLSRVPQGDHTVDLVHSPISQPNLNVQLCGMRGPMTATYRDEGAGIVLDWDRSLLPSLQIWHTDRGVDDPPWHGQYRGLGLEPIAAAFDLNDAVSTGANPINARGVATAIRIDPAAPLTIRHSVKAFSTV